MYKHAKNDTQGSSATVVIKGCMQRVVSIFLESLIYVKAKNARY